MYSVILGQLSVSSKTLVAMPKHRGGFLVLSCFAIDEISELHRLLAAVNVQRFTNEACLQIHATQLNSVVRNLSLKLLEYEVTRKKFRGRAKAAGDVEVIDLFKKFDKEFTAASSLSGKKVADAARDQMTAHFSIDEAIKAVERRDGDLKHNVFMHADIGNSHYTLGEEILFLNLFEQPSVMGANEVGNAKKGFTDWAYWVLEMIKCVRNFHSDYFALVRRAHFPNETISRIYANVDQEKDVGRIGLTYLPLFWFN